MIDTLAKAERSECMRRIRGKNTRPEMFVRRLVYGMGYRFRLHRKDLPGCPDLVFPRYKKALFVHGCFWHSHPGCKRATIPKSHQDYWRSKLEKNRDRDKKSQAALLAAGWDIMIVWECEIKNNDLTEKIKLFLSQPVLSHSAFNS
jgi:DNA mismatch endonuclease (patch repair protein)